MFICWAKANNVPNLESKMPAVLVCSTNTNSAIKLTPTSFRSETVWQKDLVS